MLRPANPEALRMHLGFAWQLAQTPAHSSFPTYLDGVKTRADFEKTALSSVENPHGEVLLFEKDGALLGWIQYYWLPEDRYLGFESFLAAQAVSQLIDEFLAYAKAQFPGYVVSLGLPAENPAAPLLSSRGFVLAEESDVFVLHLEQAVLPPDDAQAVSVTEAGFPAFAALHDQTPGRYWNSARLYRALQTGTGRRWRLLLYQSAQTGEALGSMSFVCTPVMAEIFSADFKNDRFCAPVMQGLLTHALHLAKAAGERHMVFFASGGESAAAQAAGMEKVARYLLFEKVL